MIEGETINVDDLARPLDVELHQIDKCGPAGNEANLRTLLGGGGLRCGLNGLSTVVGWVKVKLSIVELPVGPCCEALERRTCWTAATMLG